MIVPSSHPTGFPANYALRFHSFFSAIDNHKMPHFLYLTSAGISAVKDSDAISLGGGGTNADIIANDSTDEHDTQPSGVEDS